MKWICTYCASPCLVEVQGISTTNPNACIYKEARAIKPNWKRVDEPPIKDCPPFKQDEPITSVLEMAGDLKALKERVDALEERQRVAKFRNAAGIALKQDDEKIKTLEHQMRDHYHCRHGGTAYLNRVGYDRKRILERVEALENQPYAAAIDHLNLRAQVKKLEGWGDVNKEYPE